MKKTLPKNIYKKIGKFCDINFGIDVSQYIDVQENLEELIEKIIKEVRKDYLWELKEDLEVTINMLMKRK